MPQDPSGTMPDERATYDARLAPPQFALAGLGDVSLPDLVTGRHPTHEEPQGLRWPSADVAMLLSLCTVGPVNPDARSTYSSMAAASKSESSPGV